MKENIKECSHLVKFTKKKYNKYIMLFYNAVKIFHER